MRETPVVPPAARAAVALDWVTKVYSSGAQAVTAVDQGDRCVPAPGVHHGHGALGSAKTTLLQVASGIDRPTSGQVRIGDAELGASPPPSSAAVGLPGPQPNSPPTPE